MLTHIDTLFREDTVNIRLSFPPLWFHIHNRRYWKRGEEEAPGVQSRAVLGVSRQSGTDRRERPSGRVQDSAVNGAVKV
jgi:hypothetical protein